MNNLNDLEKKYKEMGEEIERLKAKPAGGRLWLPKMQNGYVFVEDSGGVDSTPWMGDSIDRYNFALSNVFKTRQEAEDHSKYLQALYEVNKYIAENFPAWEPDWTDHTKNKWVVGYNNDTSKLVVYVMAVLQELFILPYLENREQAEQLIDAQRENLLVLFGVKS